MRKEWTRETKASRLLRELLADNLPKPTRIIFPILKSHGLATKSIALALARLDIRSWYIDDESYWRLPRLVAD